MSKTSKLLLLFIFLILSLTISLFLGSINTISMIKSVFSGDAAALSIITDIRIPRILNAVLVGSALSCSGIILQSLLKNNLAEPGLLGISAGAGLGAIIIFLLPFQSTFALLPPVSFISGILATALIFITAKNLESRHFNYISSNKIILAGIALNALLSSVNGLLLLLSGSNITQIIYWLNGGLSGKGWNEFLFTFPIVFIAVIFSFLLSKDFDVMYLGEELSVTLGLNLKRMQLISVILSSLLAAAAVSIAGIISFVGLIIPNISKLIFGSGHKYIIPGSVLLGSSLLVLSDAFARSVIAPSELPAGIVTSLIGAPIFIYLIVKKQNI